MAETLQTIERTRRQIIAQNSPAHLLPAILTEYQTQLAADPQPKLGSMQKIIAFGPLSNAR